MVFLNLLAKIINAVTIVVDLLLSMRFILLLFRVEPASGFLYWIIKTTDPLTVPFRSLFQNLTFSNLIIDFPTLFAIIAYGIAGTILFKLVSHPTKSD